MCTGVEIALLASAAVGTAGAIQSGKQAEAMADYNVQIAENEAIAARQKAEYDEMLHRKSQKEFQARQRAAIAASGGETTDFGDLLDQTVSDAELDALAIRYGSKTAQQAALQSGTLSFLQGQQAKQEAYTRAGTTLLSGATTGMSYGVGSASTTTPKIQKYSSPSYNPTTGRTGMR